MIFLEKEAEQDESSEYMEMSYRMGIAEDKEVPLPVFSFVCNIFGVKLQQKR